MTLLSVDPIGPTDTRYCKEYLQRFKCSLKLTFGPPTDLPRSSSTTVDIRVSAEGDLIVSSTMIQERFSAFSSEETSEAFSKIKFICFWISLIL